MTLSGGVATANLAAEATPTELDDLVASIRTQAGVPASVRLAPVQRVVTGSP